MYQHELGQALLCLYAQKTGSVLQTEILMMHADGQNGLLTDTIWVYAPQPAPA